MTQQVSGYQKADTLLCSVFSILDAVGGGVVEVGSLSGWEKRSGSVFFYFRGEYLILICSLLKKYSLHIHIYSVQNTFSLNQKKGPYLFLVLFLVLPVCLFLALYPHRVAPG